jgi:hypothetical protein
MIIKSVLGDLSWCMIQRYSEERPCAASIAILMTSSILLSRSQELVKHVFFSMLSYTSRCLETIKHRKGRHSALLLVFVWEWKKSRIFCDGVACYLAICFPLYTTKEDATRQLNQQTALIDTISFCFFVCLPGVGVAAS